MNRCASEVRVTFELTFGSMTSLWEHAAQRAAADHGFSDDEIVDMFGPREDPDAAACAAMLFDGIVREDGLFDSSVVSVAPHCVAISEPPKTARSTGKFWIDPVSKRVSPTQYFGLA